MKKTQENLSIAEAQNAQQSAIDYLNTIPGAQTTEPHSKMTASPLMSETTNVESGSVAIPTFAETGFTMEPPQEKQKWYLKTGTIAACFMLWPLVIPFFVGIFLLKKQSKVKAEKFKEVEILKLQALQTNNELAKSKETQESYFENMSTQMKTDLMNFKNEIDIQKTKMVQDFKNEQKDLNEKRVYLDALKKDVNERTFLLKFSGVANFDNLDAFQRSVELRNFKTDEYRIVNDALQIFFKVESDFKADPVRKLVAQICSQTIQIYVHENDKIFDKLTTGNFADSQDKLALSFQKTNLFLSQYNFALPERLFECKLNELCIIHANLIAEADNETLQTEFRGQLNREEQAYMDILAEYEVIDEKIRDINNSIKEKSAYSMMTYNPEDRALYKQEILALNDHILELQNERKGVLVKERALSKGHVFITSSIGLESDGILEIGTARSLNVTIKENYFNNEVMNIKIYAAVYCDNTDELEKLIAEKFEESKVDIYEGTAVGFKVAVSEIEEFVKSLEIDGATFTTVIK